jgi:hypothetical protein
MLEMIDRSSLQVAKGAECTGCGANLLFNAELQALSCNFCGHALTLADLRQVEVIDPDEILPFTTGAEQFSKSALAWLMSGHYVPTDVLARASFSDNLGVYIPCVFYSGTYTADWSAQIGVERRETIYVVRDGRREPQEKTWIEYHPQNGRAHGDFQFVACASTHLPEEQKRFVEAIPISGSERYDERLTLGFARENLTSDVNASALFDARLTESMRTTVNARVRNQISGDHIKDVRFSYDQDLNHVVTFLMPIWLLSYDYQGDRYTIIMDGRDAANVSGTRPQDDAQKKAVRIPFYIAGATIVAAAIGYGASDTLPVLQAGMAGPMAAGAVMLAGAFAHRWQMLRSHRLLRARALEAHHNGAGFDVDGEVETMRGGRWSPRNIWFGALALAGVTLASTDAYTITASVMAPAVAPTVAAPQAASMAPPTATPDDTTTPSSTAPDNGTPADTNGSVPESDVSAGSASDQAAPPQTDDAPASQADAPQYRASDNSRSTAVSTAPPTIVVPPRPAADPNASAVADMLGDARRCLATENYDCAEADLHNVLRLRAGDPTAAAMLDTIAQKRREAMQSSWNAH